MGRYTEAKCRLCRREGEKLFLKGEKCYTEKCPVERRPYAPGMHAAKVGRLSQYGIHLREKQKAKRIYGLREEQFRRYVERAKRVKGVTGDFLLELLERRLDNVVYRAGLATSRAQARQLVTHGHFMVNERSVNIPSFLVRPGDIIELKPNAYAKPGIKALLEAKPRQSVPAWLERRDGRVQVLDRPKVDQLEHKLQMHLIVEYYSR
ncbi:MAG: 30S ribosomal protein S4 [Candidatus Bipolaricaulota bacterium]|nr:30S ribosomal protein S4 [Candidatus Bipolaricaulota bacterium]MCS7275048.1 30S ribosomal protein S4 [Candidatus Bipolaricaulota bacterium]MDW8110376.1 30S ribosomal protein S4 [Candidatus Bipolaricaulota bacterium]MDW8329553.1 30S ribosomal protein S4 [Candidatus Bipolaricaulota bacterium]